MIPLYQNIIQILQHVYEERRIKNDEYNFDLFYQAYTMASLIVKIKTPQLINPERDARRRELFRMHYLGNILEAKNLTPTELPSKEHYLQNLRYIYIQKNAENFKELIECASEDYAVIFNAIAQPQEELVLKTKQVFTSDVIGFMEP